MNKKIKGGENLLSFSSIVIMAQNYVQKMFETCFLCVLKIFIWQKPTNSNKNLSFIQSQLDFHGSLNIVMI